MAQIRSKQIADFAAILDWTTVDSAAIAPAVDIYNLVSTETSQRVSADNSVKLYASTEMSTEVVNRLSGDASVKLHASTELSTEASIRAAADVVLSNNLSTEVAARAAADVVLSNNLSTEVVNRTTADATLSTALSIEIDNRMAADWMAEELVTGVEGGTQITTANMFYGGNQDLEIYVNGLRVKYTMIDGQNFDLSIVYDLEETDKVIVLGVAVQ